MRQTVNASIAGIAFVLDQAAYDKLNSFLARHEEAYRSEPGSSEIMDDIEARIVEIVLSQQDAATVVEVQTVERAIEQIGYPDETQTASGPRDEAPGEQERFPKRLYRNPEGAKLSGVCSGLATYFNVDVVWVRLLFFMPLILTGSFRILGFGGLFAPLVPLSVLTYVIMWLVVPVARTPRQKLEMNGRAVTAESIRRRLTEGTGDGSLKGSEPGTVMANIFVVIGRIFIILLKVWAFFMLFVLAVSVVALLVAAVSVLLGNNDVSIRFFGLVFENMEGISSRMYFSIIMSVCVLPLLILCYLLASLVFGYRIKGALLWTMSGVWLIALVYGSAVTINNVNNIRDNIKVLEEFFDRAGDHPARYNSCHRTYIIDGDTLIYRGKLTPQGMDVLEEIRDARRDGREAEWPRAKEIAGFADEHTDTTLMTLPPTHLQDTTTQHKSHENN